ncbi:MAG: hypothetical protein ACO2OR_06270 [Desulfurococcaceae archaeon]
MKPLLDALSEHIDKLIYLVESSESLAWSKRELEDLKNALISAQRPLVPNKSLLTRYVKLYSTIEELIETINALKDPVYFHQVLPSIREDIGEFINALKKSYLAERVQLSLPVVLCLIVALLRLLEGGSLPILVGFLISTLALGVLFYYPQVGLTVNSVSGLLIASSGSGISDVFLGSLLSAVSLTYTLIIAFVKSKKFTSRVSNLLNEISNLVKQIHEFRASSPSNIDVSQLVGELGIDDSGFLKYTNREALLKYKALIAAIHGFKPINKSLTSTTSKLISSQQSN